MSWNDAQQFCRKLSQITGKHYRLPSESQWQYACRSGSKTKWCFGDDENQLKDYAWYKYNAFVISFPPSVVLQHHSVGQKKANQWGLYDMHGNVWEWCEDDWHKNYQNTPDDGKPWTDENANIKAVRGGSWNNDPNNSRSACRGYNNGKSGSDIGFRVVCG